MNQIEIARTINSARLANKNDWYFCTITTEKDSVRVKGYGTWLQKFLINGIDHSNGMGMTVKEYKEYLSKSLQCLEG